jgi:hypothetical protein
MATSDPRSLSASSRVKCISISEGVGIGSDHKPLILDVRLRANAANRPSSIAQSP